LHRAENVDDVEKLEHIIDAVEEVAKMVQVVWPVHPRLGPLVAGKNIYAYDPMAYLPFISLLKTAKFVMTDSGGVQEETTALGIPCLTLRESTERRETVAHGTNRVIGTDPHYIVEFADALKAMTATPPKESWRTCARHRNSSVF
jgi:UDP-N-acetylglucosamine 2-epimerase (non-hydrolysing)